MMTLILGLSIAGTPWRWLTPKEAAWYHATEKVAWSLGDEVTTFRGGFSRMGIRSEVGVKPIIAISGSDILADMQRDILPLSNELLFKRDRYICGYCGDRFQKADLTRDHIMPRAHGGIDNWLNVVSACRDCNRDKGCTLPQDWRPLLYVPYAPSRWEHFILSARAIRADQMEYLSAKLPAHSRASQ